MLTLMRQCPPVNSFMWIQVAINLILLPLKRELLSSKVYITGVPPAAPAVPGHHTRVRVPLLPRAGGWRGRGRDHGGRHPRGAPAGVVHAAGLHRLLGPLRSVITIYFMLYCVHAGLQDNIYYLLYLHIWRHFNYVFWFGQMIDNNSLTIRFVVYLIQ